MTSLIPWKMEKAVHMGALILVNADCPYPEGVPNGPLVPLPGTKPPIRLQKGAASQLLCLLHRIHAQQEIVPVSGWRSLQDQQHIWNQSQLENGQAFTETYVAKPGCSEHQTGLAVDLGKNQEPIDFIRPDFPYNGICQTFREQAAAYGFVERYPKGRGTVTGIGHEPWHFRFVGVPHAQIMKQHGLVLEEYIAFLRQFPYGQKPYCFRNGPREAAISFLEKQAAAGTIWQNLPHQQAGSVSGNNVDGFIITEWRHTNA